MEEKDEKEKEEEEEEGNAVVEVVAEAVEGSVGPENLQ